MMEWIVTSSAMILIVIALRGILKGKISLKLQYGLWALVLIRLLLPFSIADSVISISNVLSAPVIREADDAVNRYQESYDTIRSDYAQRGETVTDDDLRLQVQQELYDRTYEKLQQEYTQTGNMVENPDIQTELRLEAQQQVEVISLTAVITEALPYLWILGMIVVAVVLIGSNLHFGWKLYKSRQLLDLPGVPLKVYLTDYVATPCLFGFLTPDIYLTREVMQDSKMRGHVLAHEMSHYRQGDHIWSMLRCVCLVLHWYNPLVWAAAILSKQDAELACDESTIKALGEVERVAYGRTLIGMTCVRRDPSSLMLTATTMLGTKKTLKERIALIAKKPKTALYTLIACVLVAAIAVSCTFTGAPAQTEEEKLLDRCRDAVEYIQNLQHFEITEHYESIEESDYILGPNSVEARYVHSGDDWYHNRITVDWTWQFLEKDGEQFRKDITGAVPEEDIPAIEWTREDLSENNYAQHAWIMDIHWDEETIEFLTYTGNGDGYEGGSLTPVSVTSATDGDAELIRVEFEVGTENMVNVEDAEGTIWIFTFRFDRETGIVTEVKREIVMEDRELIVGDETEIVNFRSASTLTITPGTEEEMSAIIDDIYYGEIVTVVPTPDDPTDPSTLPGDTWTSMGAVLVNDQGEVLETLELTVQIMTWEQEGRGYYSLRFDYPENIHNSGQGVLPYGEYEYAYTCSSGSGVEKGPDGEQAWDYYVGFDAEKECFIVDFDDGEDVYLIAYRSPDANITDLWDHFQDFIAMRPENFPTVNGATTEPTTEPTAPLTVEEQFQQMLNGDYWYMRIMGCTFQDPADISMEHMFYTGMEQEERTHSDDFTEAEINFLKERLRDTWWGEENWGNAHKLPASRLDEILQEYLGVSLSDVTIPDNWMYYPDTDAYYVVHTDAYAVGRTVVTRVVDHDDGTIGVYYTIAGYYHDTATGNYLFGDTEMVLTLRQMEDGHYQVLSNHVDPDSLSYLLLNHELGPLFKTGFAIVHIDSAEAESARTINVEPALLYGLAEHLDHYDWSETDLAGSGDFQEQIHFRNVEHENYSMELELTVLSDGTYLLRYSSRDDYEVWTTSHWLGTPKSSDFGTAAEDVRAFIDGYWPE